MPGRNGATHLVMSKVHWRERVTARAGAKRVRDIVAVAEACRDDDAREKRGLFVAILPPVASTGRGR